MDLFGPISTRINGAMVRVPSVGKHLYGLNIACRATNYVYPKPLKLKSDAAALVVQQLVMVQRQHNPTLKKLCTDNGTEFTNSVVQQYITANGIVHITSPAYTPALNGFIERINGIIAISTKSMLLHANAPLELWCEAYITACYLHNRTGMAKFSGKTPYEMVYGTAPKVKHLKVFGCDAFVLQRNGGKYDPLTLPGVMVGYQWYTGAYRILMVHNGTITTTRDVKFIESSFKHMIQVSQTINIGGAIKSDIPYDLVNLNGTSDEDGNGATITTSNGATESITTDLDRNLYDIDEYDSGNDSDDGDTVNGNGIPLDEPNADGTINVPDEATITGDMLNPPLVVTRSGRVSKPVTPFYLSDRDVVQADLQALDSVIGTNGVSGVNGGINGVSGNNITNSNETINEVIGAALQGMLTDTVNGTTILNQDDIDQTADLSMMSYKQAMARHDASQWSIAMEEELKSLMAQQIGDVVQLKSLPSGTKPLTCRWLYKIKFGPKQANGALSRRYKARLVVHGHKQTYGIDYQETFAPVAKHKSIKLLLALAAHFDMEIDQLDFVTAFLNGILDDTVYITLPNGCGGLSGATMLLRKAVYGLKQAPRVWNHELHNTISGMGYYQSKADPCIYIKHHQQGLVVLAVYVDDTIIVYNKAVKEQWYKDKATLNGKYNLTDMGEIKWLLNMLVVRDRANGTIHLSQQQYIENVLLKYHGYTSGTTKQVLVPLQPYITTEVGGKPLSAEQHALYRSLIGAMAYAAMLTRPDISYAIAILSRFLHQPYQMHLNGAFRLLRYLSGTQHYCLAFKKVDTPSIIEAFSDASYATDIFDRKSTTGSLVMAFGCTIGWCSGKQPIVSLSSTEAEYIALSDTVKDVLWYRTWIEEIFNGATSGKSSTIKPLSDYAAPSVLWCDNLATKELSSHDGSHQRTKHIDVRYHHLRDSVLNGAIVVKYVPTTQQLADVLTKPFTDVKQFNYLIGKFMHCALSHINGITNGTTATTVNGLPSKTGTIN
jgi:hypothetical protein